MDGFELLDVELEAAIAIDADSALIPCRHADRNAGREAEAHGTKPCGMEDTLAGTGGIAKDENLNSGTGTARDHLIFRSDFLAQDFGEVVDADLG